MTHQQKNPLWTIYWKYYNTPDHGFMSKYEEKLYLKAQKIMREDRFINNKA